MSLPTAELPEWATPIDLPEILETAIGYAPSPKTLNKLRCIGGGPPFKKVGRRVLYDVAGSIAHYEAKSSGVVHSTSELAAKF